MWNTPELARLRLLLHASLRPSAEVAAAADHVRAGIAEFAARKRLAEENIKKAEAQLPSHKKSSASLLERDMHFQRLSMPPSHRRMPRQQYHVRGSAAAEAAKQRDRPAWFGGATGREGLHKVLEKSGRHVGAVH